MALYWSPRIELTAEETWLLKRSKKAKIFGFLREHRHALFDDAFQSELAAMYSERTAGKAPVAPAKLALVTILQAALGLSDEDAVEAAQFERRWQMLLDCMEQPAALDERKAPFSQGTLFNFRQRLIAHDMDRRLLERTVEFARATKGYSHRALRAAFDASPLFGAGRVEDTFNLIGHAARDVLHTAAKRLGISVEHAAERAGITLVTQSSLKAALDINWDSPHERRQALERLLGQVRSLSAFLDNELAAYLSEPPLREQWATLEQIVNQDLEPDPDGGGMRIKRGVAKERRISIRDGDMRHGRKNKTTRVDGFKRHVAVDLETTLILAVAVTSANRPEAEAAGDLVDDVAHHKLPLESLHIDRGYLAANAIDDARAHGVDVFCKPFPLRNRGLYTKAEFQLNWDDALIICPANHNAPLRPGTTSRFAAAACDTCEQRSSCTTAKTGRGRSVSIHPQEAFYAELRARAATQQGRAQLRKRIPVEHRLAAISRSQGKRARYIGIRKNLFDLRRHAMVVNLHAAARAA